MAFLNEKKKYHKTIKMTSIEFLFDVPMLYGPFARLSRGCWGEMFLAEDFWDLLEIISCCLRRKPVVVRSNRGWILNVF